jgi:hypothetical protein
VLLVPTQAKDPSQRASAAQLLAHPWVQGQASSAPISGDVLDNMKRYTSTNELKKAALQV